jgi:hypothetical protein
MCIKINIFKKHKKQRMLWMEFRRVPSGQIFDAEGEGRRTRKREEPALEAISIGLQGGDFLNIPVTSTTYLTITSPSCALLHRDRIIRYVGATIKRGSSGSPSIAKQDVSIQ